MPAGPNDPYGDPHDPPDPPRVFDPAELVDLWMQLDQTVSMLLMLTRRYSVPIRTEMPNRLAYELAEIRAYALHAFERTSYLTQETHDVQDRRLVPDRRHYLTRRHKPKSDGSNHVGK